MLSMRAATEEEEEEEEKEEEEEEGDLQDSECGFVSRQTPASSGKTCSYHFLGLIVTICSDFAEVHIAQASPQSQMTKRTWKPQSEL